MGSIGITATSASTAAAAIHHDLWNRDRLGAGNCANTRDNASVGGVSGGNAAKAVAQSGGDIWS